jgi:hypothetical protein
LRLAHEQSSFKNSSDQSLLDFGHAICGLFDAGDSEIQVTAELLKNQASNETADDLGYIEGASVVTFCPTHLDQFQTGSAGGHPAASPTPTPITSSAPRPEVSSAPPAGALAKCNDGTYSFAANHQGACSHHGGVALFYR